MAKRVLLISYYWPPAGGPGVQRWLKMVKYLARSGWEITVYTPKNPELEILDPTLLSDIPDNVHILTRKIFEPTALYGRLAHKKKAVGVGLLAQNKKKGFLYRLMLWVRANCFIPDARAYWIKPSVRYLKNWLKDNPQDLLVTTGPPHSMHLIGLGIKLATKIPWVADFRDPWVNIDYHQHLPLTQTTRKKHIALEKRVAETADALTIVTEAMKDDFCAYTPRKLVTILNGFDPEDFPPRVASPETSPAQPFRLVYTGSMNADRNPLCLWEALRQLHDEKRLHPKQFCVELFGFSDASIQQTVQKLGISPYIVFHANIPHEQIPKLLSQASMLLLCINQAPTSKAILTGKVFEYLAAARPILAFAPIDGAAATLLTTTTTGTTFDYNTTLPPLKQFLLDAIQQHAAGTLSIPNTQNLAPYTRSYQAEQFAELFDYLINHTK